VPDVTTATAKEPATILIDRQTGEGHDTYLDLNVRAFKPARRGAVEAVVTLVENKPGGREIDVGSFTVAPAKKFAARNPGDELSFRLDATQALADLGPAVTAVTVKVRLEPVIEGHSTAGAKLTLGKVQFVPVPHEDDAK
jgi:hypothetical protein